MKTVTICGLVLLAACKAFPCLNITGTKYNTESTTYRGSGALLLRHYLQVDRRDDGVRMEAELRRATDFNDRSDYAVALLYLGRNQEAIDLLNSLEKENPGKYFIAANLGTAYELAGDNKSALKWINEGIQRDPNSHKGNEWLHAKILEAKIGQQKDPAYFQKHSVLELHPAHLGSEATIGDKRMSPRKLAEAIQYQLQERLQCVKPPEPAVASLLFDYAAIEAATKTLESAKEILSLAVEYGYPPDQVNVLLKDYDRRIAWRKTKQYATYCLIGLAFVGLLAWLYKRKIFVLSAKDLKRA